jgi:hypothetical protein
MVPKWCSGACCSLKGNPVKIGDGPAAVIGDEHCKTPLLGIRWEGAVSRTIRESEDLPGQKVDLRG